MRRGLFAPGDALEQGDQVFVGGVEGVESLQTKRLLSEGGEELEGVSALE